MNISLFIARKLYFHSPSDSRITKLATQIATLGVIIGLAVMILSLCILFGFKSELTEKIVGFGSHIQILHPNATTSPEGFPIGTDAPFRKRLTKIDGVKHVQRFSNKMGIIKTDEDFKGVMLKGIGEEYDETFLRERLVKGTLPVFTKKAHRNDIVISQQTANQMNLKVGDKLYAYFFEQSIRTRLYHVVGIFQTDMSQFDENIVIANLYSVNRLNNWQEDQSSGLELMTNDFKTVDITYQNVLQVTRNAMDHYGNAYSTFTIRELYASIFDWLKLLDLNVWVILGLMICVACFTMISGLLILILDRTNTIGILKALGSSNTLIRKIFLNYSSLIMLRGLIGGNLLGLGLAFLQQQTRFISLDAAKYYVDHVPILFDFKMIAILNLATVLMCILAMIGPSYMVSRISPAKAIKFD